MLPENHPTHPPTPALTLIAAALAGYTVGAAARRHLARQRDTARHAANTDPLTHLPNRRAAHHTVDAALRAGTPFALAILDLDGFKRINDLHGHLAGDDILVTVAHRLHAATPHGGHAARLAGDEFLLLLPHPGHDLAGRVRAVVDAISEPVRLGAATLRPHASAGVATTANAPGWRELLTHADTALYRAKATGGGVAVHDPTVDDVAHTRTRRRRPGPATTEAATSLSNDASCHVPAAMLRAHWTTDPTIAQQPAVLHTLNAMSDAQLEHALDQAARQHQSTWQRLLDAIRDAATDTLLTQAGADPHRAE